MGNGTKMKKKKNAKKEKRLCLYGIKDIKRKGLSEHNKNVTKTHGQEKYAF